MKWVGRVIRFPTGIIILFAMLCFTVFWGALLWGDEEWPKELKAHLVWMWSGEET
jgi:hypothetical protein